MKQRLKRFVMITLNSNKKDTAQYEVLPTKAMYSVHIKIDLSQRIKRQPSHDITCVVKTHMKCSLVCS